MAGRLLYRPLLAAALVALAACAPHDAGPRAVAAVGHTATATALAVVDALPLPAPKPAAPAARPCIPDRAVDLIVAFEIGSPEVYTRRYTHPVWPGASSGATVGVGYDLGYRAARVIAVDWAAHPQHPRMQTASGITGPAARAVTAQIADVSVTYGVARAVFDQTSVVEHCRIARRVFVPERWDAAPPMVQGALASLVFNRGGSMSGDSRTEMRAIRDDCLPRGDAACVAAQIRAMKRIWRGGAIERGMSRRRDAEADLAESKG